MPGKVAAIAGAAARIAKSAKAVKSAKKDFKGQVKKQINVQKKRAEGIGDNVVAGVNQLASTVKLIGNPIKNAGNFVKDSWENIKKGTKGIGKILFNHKEWYQHYPISNMVGANFARRKGIYEDRLLNWSVPTVGVLQVELVKPEEPSDSYNQAIDVMYNRIRRANAGAVNYGPDDLDLYVDAVRSLHVLFFQMRRAYSTLFNFSAEDASVPAAYFRAYGLDYDTFALQSGNLRNNIVIMANQLRELCPLDIDIIRRGDWMFSNIFAESDDLKASVWVFRPGQYRYYNGTSGNYTLGTGLASDDPASNNELGMTYATFMQQVRIAVSAFVGNTTFQIIAGDILKAFGSSALFDNTVFGPTESLSIIYDEAALTQIQNATVIHGGPNDVGIYSTLNQGINASTGRLETGVQIHANMASNVSLTGIGATLAAFLNKPLINMYKDDIDSGDILSATRFTMAVDGAGTSAIINYPSSAIVGTIHGTEYVNDAYAVGRTNASSNPYQIATQPLGMMFRPNSNASDSGLVASYWSGLDWAPCTIIFELPNNSTQYFLDIYLWDFNNYAVVNEEEVGTYHAICASSLLYVIGQIKRSNATEEY